VASNVRTNVRELEGAMTRLIAGARLNHMEITLASTQQCLKQFIDMQVRKDHHRVHSARRQRELRHESR